MELWCLVAIVRLPNEMRGKLGRIELSGGKSADVYK